MNLDQAAQLAQTAGLIMLAFCFAAALAYAFWPPNRRKFEHAARAPLESDDHE